MFIYCIGGLYEFHKVCHRQNIPQCLQKGIKKTYEKMALMYLRFQLIANKTSWLPYDSLSVVGKCSQSWVGYPSEDKGFNFEC